MNRRLMMLIAAVAAASALLAAGCGGDDDEDREQGGTETTTPAEGALSASLGDTVDVKLTEYALDPANPVVDAGEVTFNATNDGKQEHSIEVEGPKGEAKLPAPLKPGASGSLKVDLSKPGTYTWYCPVGNHKDLAMQGAITVK